MTALGLAPVDGGLRAHLTEAQWVSVVAAGLGADEAAALPDWARPSAVAAEPVELDEALAAAVRLRRTALVEIEVAAAVGARAVMAHLWTDGRVGASLVRGFDVRAQGDARATRLRPGVEVSAFGPGTLLDEVLRLVPPAAEPDRSEVAEVTLPVELTVGFATALRRGDSRTVAAICADLGVERPPAVVESVVLTLDGNLVVSVRSRALTRVSALSWLHCDVGWVELLPTADEQVRHVPRRRADLERLLLSDLTGRLDTALRDAARGDTAPHHDEQPADDRPAGEQPADPARADDRGPTGGDL